MVLVMVVVMVLVVILVMVFLMMHFTNLAFTLDIVPADTHIDIKATCL